MIKNTWTLFISTYFVHFYLFLFGPSEPVFPFTPCQAELSLDSPAESPNWPELQVIWNIDKIQQ